MAKGNLFLGMGRGKVGDVVFYRMNGWQMARVRNRTPKNPRSNEQLYQRAVIATVMKAYSAGKEIFDHAFQGYTVGEGCMRRFNSINARILREQMITDINEFAAPGAAQGRFVAPHSSSSTPIIGMQVSEGTLKQNFFGTKTINETYVYQTPNLTGTGIEGRSSVNEMLDYLGISAGDIFTFVFMLANLEKPVYTNPWYPNAIANQYETGFAWIRFIVKNEIPQDKTISDAVWSDIFEIERGGTINVNFDITQNFNTNSNVEFNVGLNKFGGTIACIRSRDDMDLRSTEFMLPYQSKKFGIETGFILYTWQNMVQKVGQSELILEGGDNGTAMYSNASEIVEVQEGMSEKNIIASPNKETVLTPRGRRKA